MQISKNIEITERDAIQTLLKHAHPEESGLDLVARIMQDFDGVKNFGEARKTAELLYSGLIRKTRHFLIDEINRLSKESDTIEITKEN